MTTTSKAVTAQGVKVWGPTGNNPIRMETVDKPKGPIGKSHNPNTSPRGHQDLGKGMRISGVGREGETDYLPLRINQLMTSDFLLILGCPTVFSLHPEPSFHISILYRAHTLYGLNS